MSSRRLPAPLLAAREAWAGWSPRRQVATVALAAVVAAVVAVAFAVLYGVGHPPSGGETARGRPAPSPTVAAGELLRDAAAALRSTSGAHVTGRVVGTPAVSVDLAVDGNGNATGDVVTGGVRVDVVRVGGRTYLRSNDFVRRVAGGIVASVVGDRWLLLDADRLARTGIPRAIDDAASLDGVASLVASGAPTASRGPARVVGGQRVVEVDSVVGVFDVTTTRPPYPVRVAARGVTDLALDGFGTPVVVTAPSSGVIDLGKLPGIG